MKNRLTTYVRVGFFISILTGCGAIIGIPDLTFDENAGTSGGTSSGASSGSSGGTSGGVGDGSSGGTDGPNQNCNADLKTDKANCGACNHDCSNGTCTDGVCILKDDIPNGPTAIAVNDDKVYIGFQNDGPPGPITSCATNGCSSPTVAMAQISDAAASLTVSQLLFANSTIYVGDYYSTNEAAIWRLPPAGGPLVRNSAVVTNGARVLSMAADATSLYWSTEGADGVYYCDFAGANACATNTQPRLIKSTPQSVDFVALYGAKILYSSNNALFLCNSKTDCANPAAVAAPAGYHTALVVDGDTAYATANFTGKRVVFSCNLAPTPCVNPTTILEEADPITAMTVANGTVYWTTLPLAEGGSDPFINSEGVLKSCPIAACTDANKKVHARKLKAPNQMRSDAKSIYLVNDGRRGFINGIGTLLKIPRQ